VVSVHGSGGVTPRLPRARASRDVAISARGSYTLIRRAAASRARERRRPALELQLAGVAAPSARAAPHEKAPALRGRSLRAVPAIAILAIALDHRRGGFSFTPDSSSFVNSTPPY
jgi:hypothetical protein